MPNTQSSSSHRLISHPLFDANPAIWAEVVGTLRKKSFKNSDRVISHGGGADSLWLVLSGWVKLTRQTPDGKETVVGLCTQGDMFGEAALFSGANYPYTAEIVGANAELAAIPASTLRAVIAKDASISNIIMAMMSERGSQAQLKLEQLTTMSAAQRLGCFLLRLCHTQADGAKTIEIPVEKHILAAYLGMKPETLSRSQQQLKPLGIDVAGADITVRDIGNLRNFVCGSCSESGSCEAEDAAS